MNNIQLNIDRVPSEIGVKIGGRRPKIFVDILSPDTPQITMGIGIARRTVDMEVHVPFGRNISMEIQVSHGTPSGEVYRGPYEVVPEVVEQTLLTAQKLMSRNVKIYEIPYAEVGISTGGYTAIIG